VSWRFYISLALSFLLLWVPAQSTFGQTAKEDTAERFIDFTIGLGVDAHFASSLANYINLVAQPGPDQKVDIVSSAAEFYAVPELQVSENWSVGLEYSLLLKSYAIDDRSGYSQSEVSYQVHMPTLLVHRLVFGEGYRVKVGGGLGYHFASFRQRFQGIGSEETLRAGGVGLKLEAVGNTMFDESFYGSIGLDLRWDFLGTLKRRDGAPEAARSTGDLPSMTLFNAGIKFGIMFQLH
jgi:hypothetical protein